MAEWRKELRDITRADPTIGDETADMVRGLVEAESDRGCALIGGAIAENALEAIIKTSFDFNSRSKVEDLFRTEGPLRGFSTKIKVAHAFDLIDTSIKSDLDRIREIRNAFAHSRKILKFDTDAVKRACAGFSNEFPLSGYPDDFLKKPRVQFIGAVVGLIKVGTMMFHLSSKNRKISIPVTYTRALVWHAKQSAGAKSKNRRKSRF